MKIKYVANAVLWHDRANGNTYHSVRVTRCEDGKTLACPFQYGYGDHYKQTALQAMADAGWLGDKYKGQHSNGASNAHSYEMENDYPIAWNVSKGAKKDCKLNGTENKKAKFANIIPDCALCGGQMEISSANTFACFFCGHTTRKK
jgi:hypothetical protein